MKDKAIKFIDEKKSLKRGWTTGACATAATKSALNALIFDSFIDPVLITLPKGQTPNFRLHHKKREDSWAEAGIIKDAGDDPDVTHGALIISKVSHNKSGNGIEFFAGKGVGTITKSGLPLKVGEPAINPAPRKMIEQAINEFCQQENIAPDFKVEISVPHGEKLAKKTWNPRLGIVGGISILGTTGIVIPYSCSAWINSIHSGIDVALASDIFHIVGSTGDLSEKAAMAHLNLPIESYIDMGDFIGGLLKYARKKPLKKITICGGFAKISKLANGANDLHSKRSQVDFKFLTSLLIKLGAGENLLKKAKSANSANEVLLLAQEANLKLGDEIAKEAKQTANNTLKNPNIKIDILVINRNGDIIGKSELLK